MCIICLIPQGGSLTTERVRNMWMRNDDGAGYSFVHPKQGLTTKKYMKLDDFTGSFTEDHGKHGAQSPFLLHFRIATHGNIDVTNVHPFAINPRCVFAHNGIFTGLGGIKEERSDTRVFAEDVLRFLPHNFIRNPGIVKLIDDYCGAYNKLVFLNARREYLIINEESGEWSKDGNWYSNQSYMGGFSRYPVQTFRAHSADEWYDEQWWSRYSSIQPTSVSTRKTCVICLDEDNTEGYNDQYKICLYCQRSIAQLCHCELADVKPELLGLSTFTMIETHPSYDLITENSIEGYFNAKYQNRKRAERTLAV